MHALVSNDYDEVFYVDASAKLFCSEIFAGTPLHVQAAVVALWSFA